MPRKKQTLDDYREEALKKIAEIVKLKRSRKILGEIVDEYKVDYIEALKLWVNAKKPDLSKAQHKIYIEGLISELPRKED